MELITKELIEQLLSLRETEFQKDPVAYVKFFHAMSSYTAYITEYDAEDEIAFGLVCGVGDSPELGYISMKELSEVVVMGLKIERDLYYKPEALSEIRKRGY